MLWVAVDIDLAQNPKTKNLARKLGMSIHEIMGHLIQFWGWGMKYAQDGNISDFEAEDIADAAGWEGNPEEFLNAMIDCGRGSKCGFIEKTEKGMFIHDWDEYGGILEKKREQNRQRQANFRKKKNVTLRSENNNAGESAEITLYSTAQHNTAQHSTVQHSTVTTQHSTATAENNTTPPPAPAAADADADAEKISELWNEILTPLGFPRILKNTPAREKSLKARVKTSSERKNLDWWQKLFERIAQSDFLRSKNWFTLDWLLNENNLVKLLEGKYDNRENSHDRPIRTFDEILASCGNIEPTIDAEYSIIRGISPYD